MRALACLLLLAPGPHAQKGEEPEPPPEVDPYTAGDAEARARAGYVSFGPFRFGDDHTSEQVVEAVGGRAMLWAETAHFRIGSSLEEYTVPGDKEERRKLKRELQELKAVLPDVDPKTKELDPWLRLHLFAHRLEAMYATFLETFGLEEASFPGGSDDLREPYMGEGPYLGQEGKYTVLLMERASDFGRYTSRYLASNERGSHRHLFPGLGSLFFGTSAEYFEGDLPRDSWLHCQVAHWAAHNMLAGLRYYWRDPPTWFAEGLAHRFAREVDPRFFVYCGIKGGRLPPADEYEWEPKVKARVKNDFYPSLETMFAWRTAGELGFADHMMAWSKVDYVVDLGPERAGAFLLALKERPAGDAPADDVGADVARQSAALEASVGLSPQELDGDWARHVRKRYAAR